MWCARSCALHTLCVCVYADDTLPHSCHRHRVRFPSFLFFSLSPPPSSCLLRPIPLRGGSYPRKLLNGRAIKREISRCILRTFSLRWWSRAKTSPYQENRPEKDKRTRARARVRACPPATGFANIIAERTDERTKNHSSLTATRALLLPFICVSFYSIACTYT